MNEGIVTLLQHAEQLKSTLDSLRPLDKEREAIVLQKLRLDWNYHSNHLEGNSLTFGETKALILFGITAQGKPLKDHFEITGHDEAIKWVEDIVRKKEPLTENFIRQLHQLLLKNPYETNAITPTGQPTKKLIQVGQYKTTPNHVLTETGEIFRFATPEETPGKMFDLLEWYGEKETDKETNAILLAADFHYKFIRIHPFDDGNGRMARILMNFILMQYGYPPVILKTDEKAQYIAALRQADAGIFEPFFEFIITNQIRSLELMLKGAQGESIEDPDDVDKQIALLEHQLKTKGTEVTTKRSHESILTLFEESFFKLLTRFFSVLLPYCEKFYLTNQLSIDINHRMHSIKDLSDITGLYNYVEKLLKEEGNIYFVLFRIDSSSMRYLINGTSLNQGYTLSIQINFGQETIYSISNINTGKKYFEKRYNQNLSDEEIDSIIKEEKKSLVGFLNPLINPSTT